MRDIVNEIRSRDIPMDVLVIDMDYRNGKTGSTDGTEWTGWSWNKALFRILPVLSLGCTMNKI